MPIHTSVLLEYVDPAREVKEQKNFRGWIFRKDNNWLCEVPTDIAQEALKFVGTGGRPVFKALNDLNPASLDQNEIEGKFAALESRLEEIENNLADLMQEIFPEDEPDEPDPETEALEVSEPKRRGRPPKEVVE